MQHQWLWLFQSLWLAIVKLYIGARINRLFRYVFVKHTSKYDQFPSGFLSVLLTSLWMRCLWRLSGDYIHTEIQQRCLLNSMYMQLIFYGAANVSFCSEIMSDHVFAWSFVCVCPRVRACGACMHVLPACVCGSEYMSETLKVYLAGWLITCDHLPRHCCPRCVACFFVWAIWKYFLSEVSYF